MDELIYFDNCATTPLDEIVLEEILPYMVKLYANPASQHNFGLDVNKAVTKARDTVANLLHCSSDEIVFTSGATESINIALKGLALHADNDKSKIITVRTEHKAVLDTCTYLEQIGFDVRYVPVDKYGLVDLAKLEEEIDDQTFAVCVMMVNNETGTIQPIRKIVQICHDFGALMVCDATQAVGKIAVNIQELGIDVLIFSGHKIYGPKGIGVFYIRRGTKIAEIIHGGGHEKGFRSGTLNVPGIIGMASALRIAVDNLEIGQKGIGILRDTLEKELLAIPGTILNGHPELRISNVSNIYFPGIDANTFIAENKTLAVSNGSACTSSVFTPSHVLNSMGLSDEQAFASIRFSLGKFNNYSEVQKVIGLVKDYLKTRSLPL